MAQLNRLPMLVACGFLAAFSISAAPATRPAEARDELAELRQRNTQLEERLNKLEDRVRDLQRQLEEARRHRIKTLIVPHAEPVPTQPDSGPRPDLSRPDPRRNWIEREHNGLKFYLIPLTPAAESAPSKPAR